MTYHVTDAYGKEIDVDADAMERDERQNRIILTKDGEEVGVFIGASSAYKVE